MTTPQAQDPLDALQSLINDVLVQTGKALRASRKENQGHVSFISDQIQSKIPETIRQFHNALDELEFDIIKSKSVLVRDLNQLQERKKRLVQPEPHPIEPQSKRPIIIDLDSPTSPTPRQDPMMVDEARQPPMAPFPNMSIDLSKIPPASHLQQPQQMPSVPAQAPLGPPTLQGPVAQMTDPLTTHHPVVGLPDPSGMNFTDMQFSLAPPPVNEGLQSFDQTTFTPSEAPGVRLRATGNMPSGQDGVAQDRAEGRTKGPMGDPKFTGVFGNEQGAADGMDFDFSLGGGGAAAAATGGGDDSFDHLMNDGDGTFELMEPGADFDPSFFGANKTDGA